MQSRNIGRILMLLASGFMMGCSGSEQDATSVGKAIGENVVDFSKGVGQGVDSSLQVPVELTATATDAGLEVNTASQQGSVGGKQLVVYVVSKRKVSAVLVAKALNASQKEIGRSQSSLTLEEDGAQYVSFVFPPELDSALVEKYTIDLKSTAEEASAKPSVDEDSTAAETK